MTAAFYPIFSDKKVPPPCGGRNLGRNAISRFPRRLPSWSPRRFCRSRDGRTIRRTGRRIRSFPDRSCRGRRGRIFRTRPVRGCRSCGIIRRKRNPAGRTLRNVRFRKSGLRGWAWCCRFLRNLLTGRSLTSPILYFWKFRERCRVRDGYGIGSIVRFGDFVEFENHFQRVLHLRFGRPAVPADALFYLERSEFGQGDSALGDFGDDGTACLGYGDSRFDVGREKQGFDAANLRLVGVAEFADVAADFHQLFRQRDFRTRRNHSKIDDFRNRMPPFQHREAHGSGSRIYAQDN